MKRRYFRIFCSVKAPDEAGVASSWYVGRSFDSLSSGGDGLMHQNRELTHSDLQKIDKNLLKGSTLVVSFLTTKRPHRVTNRQIFPLRGPRAGASGPLHT